MGPISLAFYQPDSYAAITYPLVLGNQHKARENRYLAYSTCEWLAWPIKTGLHNRVVLWVEMEVQDIANSSLDGVGREAQADLPNVNVMNVARSGRCRHCRDCLSSCWWKGRICGLPVSDVTGEEHGQDQGREEDKSEDIWLRYEVGEIWDRRAYERHFLVDWWEESDT